MKKFRGQQNRELPQRVEQTLREFGASEGDLIVVGVSGGPDSVCLLHLLKIISEDFLIKLHIAHLDHGLRGQESVVDARFVEDLASEWKIPVSTETVPVSVLAKQKRLSVQVAAREARYSFFERVAEKTQSHWIALGHTADDQAETFLLRLLRGAGALGLSSIHPIRQIAGVGKPAASIIRPLLGVRRDEILNYLRTRSIPYREDTSNLKPQYRRNRLRQEVIPLLTSHYNPRIIETLCRTAGLLREEQDFLTAQSAKVLSKIKSDEPRPGITINRQRFLSLHRALQRVVLREAISQVRGDLAGITFRHLDDAIQLIGRGQTGNYLRMPRHVCISLIYDRFWIHFDRAPWDRMEPIILSVPGEIYSPSLGLLVRASLQKDFPSNASRGSIQWSGPSEASPPHARMGQARSPHDTRFWASFDYEKLHPPFTLRSRREGDYFFPRGMGGKKKKLQDFFVDQKIARYERDRIPLLTASEGILWVVGWRLDGRFLAGPNSQKVIVVALTDR